MLTHFNELKQVVVLHPVLSAKCHAKCLEELEPLSYKRCGWGGGKFHTAPCKFCNVLLLLVHFLINYCQGFQFDTGEFVTVIREC